MDGTQGAVCVEDTETNINPNKKPRRDLSIGHKVMILNYRKFNSVARTLVRFLEVSERTLRRMKLAKANLTKQLQLGAKDMKRQIALQKYHELGEALVQFSRRIREAHGAVSRDLLESFAMTLRNDV